MKLELIANTPDIEALIATAMLTTTSRSKPSDIFYRLAKDPERVVRLVSRVEVHHGSILDHNRLCWIMEGTDSDVLDVILRHRFFSFTRISDSKWLLSTNLRNAFSYANDNRDSFGKALIDSLKDVTPTIHLKIGKELK